MELKDPSSPRPALVYDAGGRLAVCLSCGTTQDIKAENASAAVTGTLYQPARAGTVTVELDGLALAHDKLRRTQPQALPCLTSGRAVASATVVLVDGSGSMAKEYARPDIVDDVDAYDRTEVRVTGMLFNDPDPSTTARRALPAELQPLVRRVQLVKLGADDSRGAKGSFAGAAFVDLGDAGSARIALRSSPRGGRVRIQACRGPRRFKHGEHPTRLRAVQSGFSTLADRAMAPQTAAMGLGLITFSDSARVVRALRGTQRGVAATPRLGLVAATPRLRRG